MSAVNVSSHPLIAHKMTILRDVNTHPSEFRRVLKELTFYLGYEATRDLTTSTCEIKTPMDRTFSGHKVAENVAIIPILRAGLTMSEAMLDLMPKAVVHHIGMYRSKVHNIPVQYYNRLPRDEPCDVAYIVDPCIASSNTVSAVCSILKKWGAKRVVVVSVIAAQSGIDKLLEKHPDVKVYVGSVDNELSETGMILPGIGDAGDRSFGTPHESTPVILPMEGVVDEADVADTPRRKRAKK